MIYDSFYTVESGGVRLVDWLRDRLAGKDVGSVTCSGPECELPTR